MKTYNSIQGEAEGPEASRTQGITEYKEQRENESAQTKGRGNQGGRNWSRADVPPTSSGSIYAILQEEELDANMCWHAPVAW